MMVISSRGVEEWRQGWTVVLGASLSIACGFACFPFVSSLFIQPLESEYGWSRGEQSLVQLIYIGASMLTPIFGDWVDRVGVRRVGLIFMPLVGLCFLALAAMPGSISVYYGLTAMLVIAGQGTTGVVFTRAVVGAFSRTRGTALAVTRIGVSVAIATLPALVFAAIRHFGWPAGYIAMAAVVFGIGVPATWLWVREPAAARPVEGRDAPGLIAVYGPLLKNGKVLLLSATTALMMGPIVGLISQLQPLLVGKGLPGATAAAGASVLALAVVSGTIVTGVLIDRVWAPLIGCVLTLVGAAGCLVLFLSASLTPAIALMAVAMVGVAQGMELDLVGYVIVRYFGLADFARIFAIGIMALGISSGLSSVAFGITFDQTKSYDLMLGVAAAALSVAAFLFLLLGPYPAEEAGG